MTHLFTNTDNNIVHIILFLNSKNKIHNFHSNTINLCPGTTTILQHLVKNNFKQKGYKLYIHILVIVQ